MVLEEGKRGFTLQQPEVHEVTTPPVISSRQGGPQKNLRKRKVTCMRVSLTVHRGKLQYFLENATGLYTLSSVTYCTVSHHECSPSAPFFSPRCAKYSISYLFAVEAIDLDQRAPLHNKARIFMRDRAVSATTPCSALWRCTTVVDLYL